MHSLTMGILAVASVHSSNLNVTLNGLVKINLPASVPLSCAHTITTVSYER